MNKLAVVALFTAIAAGFAIGQTGGETPGVQPTTPVPMPAHMNKRPSVIRTDGSPAVKPPPMMMQSAMDEPAPRKSVIAASTPPAQKPAPQPLPMPMPTTLAEPVSRQTVVPAEPSKSDGHGEPPIPPAPIEPPLPPLVNMPPHDGMNGHPGEKPTYSSHVLDYVSPWTARGRRCCGSVFMESPYLWFDMGLGFSWIKNDRAPPLVTTAPRNTPRPGSINDPATQVLFDGQQLHDQPFLGGRFQLGGWLDECQFFGLELQYLFFGAQDEDFGAVASGLPGTNGLFVPFLNPLTGLEDAFAVSNPGFTAGNIRINSRTAFHGVDGHFLCSAWRSWSYRVDGLVGFRYLLLNEDITIEEHIRVLPQREFTETLQVGILDHFGTRNDFIGADFGLKSHHMFWDCLYVDFLGRVAIGSTNQQVLNDGFTGVKFPGFLPDVRPTGNLVGPRNIGRFSNDEVSVVPEFGMTVGWQCRRWLRLSVGYNALFWSNVVRPGDQIDRVVNPIGVQSRNEFNTGLLIPPRPQVLMQQTDFWAQSVTLGMQFVY